MNIHKFKYKAGGKNYEIKKEKTKKELIYTLWEEGKEYSLTEKYEKMLKRLFLYATVYINKNKIKINNPSKYIYLGTVETIFKLQILNL